MKIDKIVCDNCKGDIDAPYIITIKCVTNKKWRQGWPKAPITDHDFCSLICLDDYCEHISENEMEENTIIHCENFDDFKKKLND